MTSIEVWTVLLGIEAIDPDLGNEACRSAFDTLAAEWVRLKGAEANEANEMGRHRKP